MNIIGKKNWYFLFSGFILVPGIISLVLFGLNLSIDFTGGSRISLLFPNKVNQKQADEVTKTYSQENIEIASLQLSNKIMIIRTKPLSERQNTRILTSLKKNIGDFKQEEFATVGPIIGQEITINALKALVIASFLIVFYIAWSFRKVPKPASSLRFGITAIITLLHDVFVLVGLFSLFGHFFAVEVDSLFMTALLTVMGFSVHDTIVVFDRIRENLLRGQGGKFDQLVNTAILQTLGRSINTSLTALLVLFTLLLFGGESIRWFIVALLIGIASGTYSSIFNAAPILVVWDEIARKRAKS